MNNLNDSFNIVEAPSKERIKEMAKEKAEAVKIDAETLILNKTRVENNIKALREAYHKKDAAALDYLAEEFREIYECLGDDSKETLEIKLKELENNISRNGASILNVSKLRNCKAKLGIIKYKSMIKEAAERPMKNENKVNSSYNNNDGRKLSNKILVGGVVGMTAVIAMGAAISSCHRKNEVVDNTTTNTTTSTMEETSTMEVTVSTGDYSVETVDPNYSSPTRETTTANSDDKNNNGKSNGNGNNKGSKDIDATTKHLRKQTPKNKKTVISKATSPSHKKPTEKGTYHTDKNGTEATTTKYIKPTGKNSGKLPIKPSKKTLSPEEKQAESVSKNGTIEKTGYEGLYVKSKGKVLKLTF